MKSDCDFHHYICGACSKYYFNKTKCDYVDYGHLSYLPGDCTVGNCYCIKFLYEKDGETDVISLNEGMATIDDLLNSKCVSKNGTLMRWNNVLSLKTSRN